MKRKFVCIMLVLLIALSFNAAPVMAGGDPSSFTVKLNNSYVDFGDQVPYSDEVTGRIMIPLRSTAQLLGASVDWDNSKNTAIIKKDGTTILMQVGSNTPIVNGKPTTMDAPAEICNSRVMVPLRFVSETMGCNVQWDSANQIANIYSNGVVPIQPVQTTPPEINNGGLPNEDQIQTSLTQEDIARLQAYPVSGPAIQDLKKYPADVQATFGTNFDIFNESRKAPILQSLSIFEEVCNYDYSKFESTVYREEYVNKYYSIYERNPRAMSVINGYIDDIIRNQVTNKGYLLSSQYLIYQASPKYAAIRAKYIFYQSSGAKMQEEGSTLGKWYWRDIEFLFATPLGSREGNTTGVIYVDFINLSSPQPYFN